MICDASKLVMNDAYAAYDMIIDFRRQPTSHITSIIDNNRLLSNDP